MVFDAVEHRDMADIGSDAMRYAEDGGYLYVNGIAVPLRRQDDRGVAGEVADAERVVGNQAPVCWFLVHEQSLAGMTHLAG